MTTQVDKLISAGLMEEFVNPIVDYLADLREQGVEEGKPLTPQQLSELGIIDCSVVLPLQSLLDEAEREHQSGLDAMRERINVQIREEYGDLDVEIVQ